MPSSRLQALVDPAVAEIVQHVGLLGRELERLLHVGLGLRPVLGALEHDAAAEKDRPVPLVDGAEPRDRGVVGGDGVGVAFLAAQQVGQGQRRVDALGLLGHQRAQPGRPPGRSALPGRRAPPCAGAPASRAARSARSCRSAASAFGGLPALLVEARRSSARRSRGRASARPRAARRSARGRRAGCAGRRPGCRRCRTGSRRCPTAGDGGLGIGALAASAPSITTESLYLSP